MATTRTRDPRSPGPPSNVPSPGGSGGRNRRKRRNPWLARIQLFITYILILILTAVLAVVAGIGYEVHELPSSVTDIENLQPTGTSYVYSSDGVELATLLVQNRQTVTIDKIPLDLQHATVAIEDSRFYTDNYGVDIRGITRAFFHNVQGGDMTGQGGSTITQQLVRNLGIDGIGHQKNLIRKIREAVYAIQIQRNYSKQQILEMYLNQVYYGSGAYGVQAAAETYFAEPVGKLDLAQCAMVAGLVQRPSRLSPYVDPDAALARRNVVLARMRDLGYIDSATCGNAQAEPITLAYSKPPQTGSKILHAPYFVDYVVKELTDRYGSDMLYEGGLKITTTLNWGMQKAAEQAVQQGIAKDNYLGATDAALIAMEPQTGYIRAMVGGVDYSKSQFNIAADGRRQPGSSFKPIIYTAAIDSGLITENTPILDEPITLPGSAGPWSPKNDDGIFRGWVTAKRAVADSINVPAVKVLRLVGVDTAIQYATMMGIKSPLQPYLTLALGASAVTPLEMATMYSMIANEGERPTPIAIQKIEQGDGVVLEDDEPEMVTTSIKPDALHQVSDMLRAVVTDGTASAVFSDGQPPNAHGKTGTTQSHLDVWFDGYTPKLTCVVWAGHPSVNPNTGRATYLPMHGEAWGATICAPIWKQFMIAALAIQAQQMAKAPPAPTTTTVATATAGTGVAVAGTVAANTTITQTTTPGQPVLPTQTDINDPAATLSADGKSVTVWIDDTTGLRTAPNAQGAHEQTYPVGTEPTTYVDGSHVGDSGDADGSAVTPTQPSREIPANTETPQPPPSNILGAPSQDTPATATSTPAATPPGQQMVTVTVCVESGMRATEWCPETIDRQFPANKVPGYCTIHKPPPGE